MNDAKKLDGHHRATLEKLFRHPTSHNIQWHDVVPLLEAVGQVAETHRGRYTVTLGQETETFDSTHGNDLSEQQIVDLRRMLGAVGAVPDAADRG